MVLNLTCIGPKARLIQCGGCSSGAIGSCGQVTHAAANRGGTAGQGRRMSGLTVLETGLIYRDAKASASAGQAYFPSVVRLDDGCLLASLMIGSAMEALNCQVHLCRSSNGGRTWTSPRPVAEKGPCETQTGRLTHLGDGRVVLLLSTSQRLDPEAGATNPSNLGHVPNPLSLYRSEDGGEHWSSPEPVDPPLIGPAFELCSPIVVLGDGRWLLPTSTWRGWDGDAPNGMKAVAFVSDDQGATWPRYVDVMDGTATATLFWEQKIIQLDQDRLLSVAWAYDEAQRSDHPNHFALADRAMLNFSAPTPTPLQGQTPELMSLGAGRFLCVYRRTDSPGLWSCVAHIDCDGQWRTEAEDGLWVPERAMQRTDGVSLSEGFRTLQVGAPCLTPLGDDLALLSFWVVEDNRANIRWMRLKVR